MTTTRPITKQCTFLEVAFTSGLVCSLKQHGRLVHTIHRLALLDHDLRRTPCNAMSQPPPICFHAILFRHFIFFPILSKKTLPFRQVWTNRVSGQLLAFGYLRD